MRPSDTKLKQTAFRLCSKCNRLHAGVTTCPSCASPLQLIDYSFFLGKTLGKYTIKEVLGAGGRGIVFQALHTTLDKKVALKIFIPGSDSELFEKRFLREARILAGLKHSNIIEVYDFDISQWGTPYYVMEYLEGETLGDVIKKSCDGLPLQLLSDYLEPVIQAFGTALLEALGPKTESMPAVQSALPTAPIPKSKKDKEPPPVKRKGATPAAKHPSRKEFISTEEETRLKNNCMDKKYLNITFLKGGE